MEQNYWTRPDAAIRHGFIRTAGPGENYWTRHARSPWLVRAQRAAWRRTPADSRRRVN
jgi:hypothetical protein